MDIRQTTAADRPEIEQLLDAAFGTDRHNRTAYRLRDGSRPIEALCFTARRGDHLCGSIEFWPVDIVDDETGAAHSALLLGPVAVDEACRGLGLGGLLIRHGLATARLLGHHLVILVGDPEYYTRFGFSNAATQAWRMPGPVEQRRLMAWTAEPDMSLPRLAEIRRPLAIDAAAAAVASAATLGQPSPAETRG